jgi:hypothetical protein
VYQKYGWKKEEMNLRVKIRVRIKMKQRERLENSHSLEIKLEGVNEFDRDEGGGCIQRAMGLIVQ